MILSAVLAGAIALPFDINRLELEFVKLSGRAVCHTRVMPDRCPANYVGIIATARCKGTGLQHAGYKDSLTWVARIELTPTALNAAGEVMIEYFRDQCGGSA